MPTKKTEAGRSYKVTGKKFIWSPLDEDDKTGNLPEVAIPLRVKVSILRSMSDRDLDTDSMFDLIDAVAPGQAETLGEMDSNDFVNMFNTWQSEYHALNGASPGE